MTKADLLILQDAAEEFSLESAENLGVNKSVCLQTAALAILCRVVSDLMAGEGEKDTEVTCDATYRLGWNAALDALFEKPFGGGDITHVSYTHMRNTVLALRKPAQEEVK